MIRLLGCAVAVSMVASCGGGGAPPIVVPTDYTPLVLPQNGGVKGRTFADNATQVRYAGNAYGNVGQAAVSVKVIDANTVDVIINGSAPTRFSANTGGSGGSGSGSGDLLFIENQLPGGPVAKHMLYFSFYRTDPVSGSDYADFFVDGTRTAAEDMPTKGTARYIGETASLDGADNNSFGTISLVVDFAKGTVGGSMSGILPNDTAANFFLVPTVIGANGSKANGFNTTLTSSDVAVTNSNLDGNFYGPVADEAGGTFRVETGSGNAAGIFGAFK
jgi:hypothetical protein